MLSPSSGHACQDRQPKPVNRKPMGRMAEPEQPGRWWAEPAFRVDPTSRGLPPLLAQRVVRDRLGIAVAFDHLKTQLAARRSLEAYWKRDA